MLRTFRPGYIGSGWVETEKSCDDFSKNAWTFQIICFAYEALQTPCIVEPVQKGIQAVVVELSCAIRFPRFSLHDFQDLLKLISVLRDWLLYVAIRKH